MRMSLAMIGLSACALVAGGAAAQRGGGGVVGVPLDSERMVNGVDVGCTGIGQTREDPRWLAYSVRIEFSNPARELLANEGVTVTTSAGRPVVAVTCEGPWILFKLPPGAYRAKAWLPGPPTPPATASFRAPATGQARVEVQFARP